MTRQGRRMLCIVVAVVALAIPSKASRLPIQVFATAQGLPRNSANCLVPDSSGLLWICTSEGLVRFDGSEFRTLGVAQGLPSSAVEDFLIAKDHSYWVVTDSGLCYLPPGATTGTSCRLLASDLRTSEYGPNSIAETTDGGLWFVGDRALYRASSDHRRLDRVLSAPTGELFQAIGRGPSGGLLLMTDINVYFWDGTNERKLNGKLSHSCGFGVSYYAGDQDIWILSGCGLYRAAGSLAQGDLRVERVSFTDGDSQPVFPSAFLRRRDGKLWLASNSGLMRATESRDRGLVVAETFGREQGVLHASITHLVEDEQGNLWGSYEGSGLFRIIPSGFRTFSEDDGLGSSRISSLFEDLRGDLCVTVSIEHTLGHPSHLRVKSGDRFERVDLATSPGFSGWGWGWGWNQFGLQARDGEWWFPANEGLIRYGRTARPQDLKARAPLKLYAKDKNGGLRGVFRVFEDSHRNIWFTKFFPNEFISWDRASGRFHRWSVAEGWPKDAIATVMRESATGTLWIGTFGEVLRLRNGRLETISVTGEGSLPFVRDLYVDQKSRVWIATGGKGVYRCDEPDTTVPVFQHYSAKSGLSSDSVRSLAADNAGFIYAGTVRAVDRIDPHAPVEGGNIRHYTASDGLPDSEQSVALRDRRGHLWFGTLHGLAEFDPANDPPVPLPRIYIRRMRVRGEEIPLPWAGAKSLSLDLPANKNQVEIEYAAADLRSTLWLRYQYRLQGVDSDWSAPSTRTSINYASLPAGRLSFAVRAVGTSGEVGESLATVTIELAAPLWRRWWFLGSSTLLAGFCVYWLYDYRVRHLLAVERLRTHIATDLHDDIGSSLTQISLLSEIGQRDISRNALGEIAQISRDLAREMSDIVWAVSPRHDRFEALVNRMRRFAGDALPDGQLTFDVSGLPADLALPIDYRRPLFLIFKEAVNNVARHSGATTMIVRLAVKGGLLSMMVEDNGAGFNIAVSGSGEGLGNICRRMKELGGKAEWNTGNGCGTKFLATLPLRQGRAATTRSQ